jgi:thiomorpholine-carboxylate dehydrogenase
MVAYYDQDAVRAVLRMEDLIPAMETALNDFSAGKVIQPVREMISVEGPGGFFASMPAVAENGMGTKLVSFYPGNADQGIHTHHAMIALFDRDTGVPLAVMDGGLITEMRTAAASAVATKAMAAPDAKVLAILGSGVQARSHVQAIMEIRDIEEIRVWSRTPASAQKFADEVGATAMSAEDAVRGADIVVTATSSTVPVLEGAWLKPGAHVNGVGACIPTWRELDDDVMSNIVVVDSEAGALKESGDVILSNASIHAELGNVVAGKASAEIDKITVFISLGLAVEDVASARLVYDAIES